jgi:hypothetical protein
MDEKSPRVIDAEFEVVSDPRRQWWQGWRVEFDWRVFAVITATSLMSFMGLLLSELR